MAIAGAGVCCARGVPPARRARELLTTLYHAYFALLPRIYDIFTPVPATGCTGTPGAFTTHAVNRISPALLNEPAPHGNRIISAQVSLRFATRRHSPPVLFN